MDLVSFQNKVLLQKISKEINHKVTGLLATIKINFQSTAILFYIFAHFQLIEVCYY